MICHRRITNRTGYKGTRKHLHAAGALPIAFSLLLFSCSSNEQTSESEERFPVINPVVADTSYDKEYVADIQAIQKIELRAKTTGYLESIHIDEGEYVKAGQTLFSISGKQYRQDLLKARAAVASALAEVKAAELELANAKTLVENSIISQVELDLAEAKCDALKAKVEEARVQEASARLNLSFAQIKAPFDGVVNRIPNKTGSLIEEGMLLTTLSDNREVYAYFNVSESEYLDYISTDSDKKGEVQLILNNGRLHPQKGKVETIEGEIDKSTGTLAFRARFSNPDHIIKHGSSGKVRVTTKLEKAMMVPQKSSFEIQDNVYVYVVDNNNVIQRRKIVPFIRLPHVFVISEGLSADDKILFEGIQRVKEGDRIIPEMAMPEARLSSNLTGMK